MDIVFGEMKDKAVAFLLERVWESEFETRHGVHQHPGNLNFYEWLVKHQLVDAATARHFKECNYFRD